MQQRTTRAKEEGEGNRSLTAIIALNQTIWSLERLTDEIFYNLAFYDHYYEQARELMKKIPVRNPPPAFTIKLSELFDRIVVELEASTRRGRQYTLTQAVGRVFENVDYNYYHLSIKRQLSVELVE